MGADSYESASFFIVRDRKPRFQGTFLIALQSDLYAFSVPLACLLYAFYPALRLLLDCFHGLFEVL